MKILFLNLRSVLMSFGAAQYDSIAPSDLFPNKSMLVGLIANALGIDKSNYNALNSLQRRFSYAARIDKHGVKIVDYQTVNLDNIRVSPFKNDKESNHTGTIIRKKEYISDSIVTVAATLIDEENQISFEDMVKAIKSPVRFLYIGRKSCPPGECIYGGTTTADSFYEALSDRVRHCSGEQENDLDAIFPISNEPLTDNNIFYRVEDKDWQNSVHIGRSFYTRKKISPPKGFEYDD